MNKVILIGKLGKDVELKQSNSGNQIGVASLATDKYYNGENHTTWHNLLWPSIKSEAKFINFLKKGQRIAITGEISTTKINDKYFTSVIVNETEIMFEKGNGVSSSNESKNSTPTDDDIPF